MTIGAEEWTEEDDMSWIQKKATPAVISANRSNSQKSTGPTTKKGKRRASLNAGKYYVYGQVTPERMRELNEDPAEFEKLHQSLRSEIVPRGGFEQVLVEEMAVNRWRLARLRRAETAMLVNQRDRLEVQLRYPEISAHAGTDALMMAQRGVAGITDSPQKYFQILELLTSLKETVEREGFTPEGLRVLKEVYGHLPTAAGKVLIRQFEGRLEESKLLAAAHEVSRLASPAESDGQKKERQREEFLSGLNREIKTYTSYYAARLELRTIRIPESKLDEWLVLPDEDSARIMRYEAMLQRDFERLQKQLLDWRNRQRVVA